MGRRGLKYLLIAALLLVIVAFGVKWVLRTPGEIGFTEQDEKFTEVFVAMAVAREMAGNDADSLRELYRGIYRSYDVDSAWLFEYLTYVSSDAEKHKQLWDAIVEKLESLDKQPESDSVRIPDP